MEKVINTSYVSIDMGVPNIRALTTYRYQDGYHLFNMSNGSGNTTPTDGNRLWLKNNLNLQDDMIWLRQIHGNRICDLSVFDGSDVARTGDAAISNFSYMPCTVLTADCLPILVCNQQATQVAAIHAGWRGVVAGVIQNSLEQFNGEPLSVWLGPCISQQNFEVGQDVYNEFVSLNKNYAQYFIPNGIPGKYQLDLEGVAKEIIWQYKVFRMVSDTRCTFALPNELFSYRRDGSSGCFASCILIEK
ncbi:peptidoglycan editing factor PgeF [Francisellaceae bacterium]|nr:peptidoglycan editing factor PgeF [Francisellaceae bacterium]